MSTVTLLTDFGLIDPYVGAMKGRMLELAPHLQMVDLTHEIPAGDLVAGAFLLDRTVDAFAPPVVHLAVVDPGVGTRRRPIAVLAREQWFVGPDNGLLSMAVREPELVVVLDPSRVVGERAVSATFHGRDLFAPAAARLARGDDPFDLGDEAGSMTGLEALVERTQDGLRGEVIWIDRFGNAITAIDRADLEALGEDFEIRLGSIRLRALVRTFGDVESLAPLAYIGSNGTLELAVRDGDLADRYGIDRGATVTVRPRR